MSDEKNKEIVRRSVTEFWNTGNLAKIDELYAPGYVEHGNVHPGNLHQFKETAAGTFKAFPDLRLTIEELVAEGDRVVKRWTARGTHRATFHGIPATGKSFEVAGCDVYRIAGGKLAECWGLMDALGMMQQLGVIPAAS
jgi:steroid delta-isomerase-like uncharacterized protein